MVQTSARLLRLLALLQTRSYWPGPELAERLQVTSRTLRRDMDRLRSLGFPVEGSAGVAGGYQLGAGASLPPLALDEDEALAVSIALGTMASSSVSGVEEAAVRALVKLERVLPPRLRKRAAALRATILPLERSGPRVNADILSALAAACGEHQLAQFRYAGADGKASERLVEPAGVVHTGFRWYLVAWDKMRKDWRTFRIDRVSGSVTLGEPFSPRQPPEGGDLKKYVSRNVSTSGYGHQARIVLHAPLAHMKKRVSPAAGMLEALDDQRSLLVTGAHSLQSLAFWVSTLDVEFEVQEPKELKAQLRVLAARMNRAARE